MTTVGSERYKADIRQFGGLAFALSSLITINTLTGIAAISQGGGLTPTSGLPFYNLFSRCALCFEGLVGMFHGYGILVNDKGNVHFTMFACFITQFSWLPFIGGLTGIGMAIVNYNEASPPFIPSYLDPSHTDVRWVGATGMMSILAYAQAFVGSASFMQFAIYAYQNGQASERNASYFRGRAAFYSFIAFFAGVAQLILGSYLFSQFGGGPYNDAVVVGPMTVFFPEITIFVGLVQIIVGITGIARRYGALGGKKTVPVFQAMCGFMWLMMLILQDLVQIGYGVGGALVPRAPTLGCFYLAICIMPAYLDFKMHNVPEEITNDYYNGGGVTKDVMKEVPEGPATEVA